MIKSMTAFAKHQLQSELGIATWEIRAVNNRFLDMNFRLPENLRDIELAARKLIKKYCQRGKLDIYLRYQPAENAVPQLSVNQGLLKQLKQVTTAINTEIEEAGRIGVSALLRYPGLVETAEVDLEDLKKQLLKSLEQALQALSEARAREGAELAEVIVERLDAMANELTPVKTKIPEIIEAQRERLRERLQSVLETQLDEERLAQEMVYAAQKIDVDEELDRLSVHIAEFKRMLKKGGTVGRHLDFLAQELNREANTLGSKSIHPATTQASLNLKVLIEQIREQVQNIE